jgi:molybdate transport system substrate-binding protein
MNRMLLIMVGSLAALVAIFVMLARNQPSVDNRGDVTLFCAASNRAVVEDVLAQYRAEFGRDVQVQYGASQTLLSQIEISGTGDLFLPADTSYLAMAKDKGLIAEVIPIARMQAVIAVAKGNPKSVQSYQDLLRPEVRFVQANEAAAIGQLTRAIFEKAGLWPSLDKATIAYRTTVTEATNDVLIGAADAAIVYDAVLHTYPDLEFIEIPELQPVVSNIAIGVSTTTNSSAAALHFARYLSAKDRGLTHYSKHGFRVSGGDTWSDVPSLKLFAGSMLRPAIEDTITRFQAREGVEVETVYNGCGILVAQMKAGQVPDAYFACDREFMEQVPDLFPESTDVSENELVILVQKGNPFHIAHLRDLTKPGLRVGIGHEKQCAMGWLTQNTLREGKVQKEVMENVTVQLPTGDMLVNNMLTGSLDAAVVYLSNTAGTGEKLDAVRIQGLECSIATQPYAVATDSPHAQTAGRLFQQICSADSQAQFAKSGFRWKAAAKEQVDQGETVTHD